MSELACLSELCSVQAEGNFSEGETLRASGGTTHKAAFFISILNMANVIRKLVSRDEKRSPDLHVLALL